MADPVDSSDILIPTKRFALFLDEHRYLLPAEADADAVQRQVFEAVRSRSTLKLDVEDAAGNLAEALVNPAQARIAYVAVQAVLGPPGVGTPGH